MEVNDEAIGFWVKDVPYFLTEGKDETSIKREYIKTFTEMVSLTNEMSFPDCGLWVRNYFLRIPDAGHKPLHKNGRRWYLNDTSVSKFEIIENMPLQLRAPISFQLSGYSKTYFDMASLVCSQLSSKNAKLTYPKLLDLIKQCPLASSCDPCTTIGRKIAKSLIRVAATRIFATPEQSIMELPVNSIDAYGTSGRKIGKFGMGFFSILYWLVGHPRRKMLISSYYSDSEGRFCTYHVEIKEINDVLSFKLKTVPESEVRDSGLRVYLDVKNDPFSHQTIQEFEDQLEKLRYVGGATIYKKAGSGVSYHSLTEMKTVYNKSGKAMMAIVDEKPEKVFCHIAPNYLMVEDYATGVSLDVLFGSLFVPSISTKTIKMSEGTVANFKPNARIVEDRRLNKLLILVGGIAVVSVALDYHKNPEKYESYKEYILDLPSSTRLPVSRDDIILSSETSGYIKEELYKLFQMSAKIYGNISTLQVLVDEYIAFSASEENRTLFKNIAQKFYEDNKHRLVPSGYSVYDKIPNLIRSVNYDVLDVERHLEVLIPIDPKYQVWYGRRVVLLDGVDKLITDGGLVNYLFIDHAYLVGLGENWVDIITSSYATTRLQRIGPDLEDFEKYEAASKASEIIKSPALLKFFFAILAKVDSLSGTFDIVSSAVLPRELIKIYKTFGEAEFYKILTALMNRLSALKGNQTYGGERYELLFSAPAPILLSHADDFPKAKPWLVDNIINAIKASDEQQLTVISIGNMIFPYNLQLFYEKNNASVFFNHALEVSNNLIEFTCLCIGGGTMFAKAPWAVDMSVRFIDDNIQTIRAEKYTQRNLIDWYRSWNGSELESMKYPLTLSKYQIMANYWMTSMSTIKTIETETFEKSTYPINIRLGKLIRVLFEKSVPENGLSDFLRDAAVAAKIEDTPLQITEIAINEGTTKPFIDAVLTELVQNSIDAIRETGTKNKRINITVTTSPLSDMVFLRITDYVGMDANNFLHIGIPFLSTKTPSEMVTGEMGSGFFNAYRESEVVFVNSIKDGMQRITMDTPIKNDAGRVVDVEKSIWIGNSIVSKAANATEIGVAIHVDPADAYKLLAKIDFTTKNVLGLAQNADIYYNGKQINVKMTHVSSYGKFEIYLSTEESNHQSYLLTKGIPFTPLKPLFKNYVSDAVLSRIDQKLIVNVMHGGYTPIQTRTRLNMPPDVKAQFETVVLYACFIYFLDSFYNRRTDERIRNQNSKGDANQLRFSGVMDIANLKHADAGSIVLGVPIDGQDTMAELINKCISVMGTDTYQVAKPKITKVLATYKTRSAQINTQITDLVDRWLKNKNQISADYASIQKTIAEKAKPATMADPETQRIVELWIDTYWKTAISANIKGYSGAPPKVKAMEIDRAVDGLYFQSSHHIEINIKNWTAATRKELISAFKKKDYVKLGVTLANNYIWKFFFSRAFPATTIPHELEHARRRESHDTAVHGDSTEILFSGDSSGTKTFEQCCNAVYDRVMAHGFYEKFFAQL